MTSLRADPIAAAPVHTGRRRRARSRQLHAQSLNAALDRISATMGDIKPSNVPANWTVDRKRALIDAKRFLATVDFSKRNLVVWIPGTDNDKLHPSLERAVRQQFSAADTDARTLRYMASWRIDTSMPTGLRTLRLVLAGIAAQHGNHRVLLAAESQGAWIVGEAVTDPLLAGVVSRAAIMGHPITGVHHFHDGHDPRVLEINNSFDKVTMEPWGSPKTAMDAVIALHTFNKKDLPVIFAAMFQNPHLAALTGIEMLRERVPMGVKPLLPDPHNYSKRMAQAAAWLRGAADPASLPGSPRSWPASTQTHLGAKALAHQG